MTTASTSLRQPSQSENPPLLSLEGWIWAVVIGALFCFIYFSFLTRMGRVAIEQTDWSHIPLIPVFSIIFIVLRKKEVVSYPARVFWPGLLLLLAGIFGFALGIYPGRNDMIQGYSMVLAVFGLTLFLAGPSRMKILWFPALYLVFAVVISQRYWEQIAFEMQVLAAVISAGVIQVMGAFIDLDATVTGSQIDLFFTGSGGELERHALNVEEACSGLRMLMTFLALGVAIAFLATHRRWWQRLIIAASTIPVALFVNILRVVVIAVLYAKVDPSLARGDAHIFIGMLMLIPAALIFLLIGWVLDKMFIYDPAEERARLRRRREPAKPLQPASPAGMSFAGLQAAFYGEPYPGSEGRNDMAGVWPKVRAFYRDNQNIFKAALNGVGIGVVVLLLGAAAALGAYLLVAEMLASMGQTADAIRIAAGLALLGGVCFAASVPLQRVLKLPSGRPGARELGIICGVLLAAGVGLNGAVQAMQLALEKKPIQIRRPLDSIPRQVGPWAWEAESDKRLSAEIEDALGTNEYVIRDYVYRGEGDRAGEGMMRMHVTYYTGSAGVVPHVPERCFAAGGLRPVGRGRTGFAIEGEQYRHNEEAGVWQAVFPDKDRDPVTIPSMQVPVTDFRFEDPEQPGRIHNVYYFFAANGRYYPTPDHVRAEAFNPRDQYSYHAKIELMPIGFRSEAEGREAAESFLRDVLPHVMAALPDWEAVKRGEWPPQPDE